ncbi:MAG: redoxin domain-containing protein [Pseudomonadota bacterium]|nr:redoxin domain-containing protein [Pseudomonadota bacterium]
MNTRRTLLAAMACAFGTPRFVWAALPTKSRALIGASAPAFEVIDSSKQMRTLTEFKAHPVVLEWTSPSCPFAKAQYESGRMQELQKWAIQNGVAWLTVLSSHPTRSDYLEPAKAEAFNHARGGSPSALLIDASGDVGHAYAARTANHMFIVGKDGVLVYAGGIDDGQTMDPKKVLRAHNYVRPALEDVLAGKPVRVPSTDPFGCALAYAG